ncbi:uncharacterized protein FIBRA_08077 [Fibroporia radiculosa]|uniref:DUF6699 domain-containing protein n=1 Tax=Fibroporia radiculosa TaxID=599839 RepID=J4IC59_9APHY|nr:uncharacterized protein FIBRA_08077 [Fibroporia radiculosa]CCM05841.1 predicted protein [Fibroporia radiculosa]
MSHSPHHRRSTPSHGILRGSSTPGHVPLPPGTSGAGSGATLSPNWSRAHTPRNPYPTPPRSPARSLHGSPRGSPGSPATNLPGDGGAQMYYQCVQTPVYQPAGVLGTPVVGYMPMTTPMQMSVSVPTIPSLPGMVGTPMITTSMINTPVIGTPVVSASYVTAVPAMVGAPSSRPVITPSPSGWVPHPFPHPTTPCNAFWATNILTDPDSRTYPTFNDAAVSGLSGGWPLPGRAPSNWSAVWPPTAGTMTWSPSSIIMCPWLIPNPDNADNLQLKWDITQNPSTSKRVSARGTVSDFSSKFNEPATYPLTETVHIHCEIGIAAPLWGPIIIEKGQTITVGDILEGIYDYFQTLLTEEEVQYISSLDPNNYEAMSAACYQRSMRSYSLPGYELSQGLKRADCFGGGTTFWGLWIAYNCDNTWQMNLGLVPNSTGS